LLHIPETLKEEGGERERVDNNGFSSFRVVEEEKSKGVGSWTLDMCGNEVGKREEEERKDNGKKKYARVHKRTSCLCEMGKKKNLTHHRLTQHHRITTGIQEKGDQTNTPTQRERKKKKKKKSKIALLEDYMFRSFFYRVEKDRSPSSEHLVSFQLWQVNSVG
jgi:hypothetical protein